MSEVYEFLASNKTFYLASLGLDGKPKVRPFGLVHEEGGKLYFCTSSQKNVYREMNAFPEIEISATSPEGAWIRLHGRVQFTSDLGIKQRVLDINPMVKGIYGRADNPAFSVFSLEEASATIADFSGKAPTVFRL